MRIAVPNKGRIHSPTVDLLERAGLGIENGSERRLLADTTAPGISVVFARAADIPEYVQDGAAGLGISSLDFVEETGADVELLLDLGYGRASVVLAVPDDSDIGSVSDLPNGARVVTEFPRVARRFLDERGVSARVVEVSGATEMAPQVGIADAVIDLTSTGTTLRMNRLRPIEKVLDTSVHLLGNREFMDDSQEEADQLVGSIESVIAAREKRFLVMNVREGDLDEVIAAAPGLSGPTVTRVESEEPMLSVQVVIDADRVYRTVSRVKAAGARDVLVMPIERLIP
ncbi:MAG: ATP phosphoribosyltransferase [Methanonatronarchaeales archaeon]|nr:ATP phosphoribosyltransferase [Methanonatronarchaeales archaeon]